MCVRTSLASQLIKWVTSHFSQKSSECGSAVSTKSSLSEDEDMGWSFSWPPTVWHCFLKGRRMPACTRTWTVALAVNPPLSHRVPLARDSPALSPRDQRRVARRWGTGRCRRGRGQGGAIHVFEGSTTHGRTDLVVKGRAVGELFIFSCRVTAQKAFNWWSTLRSSCPVRPSCSWPLTLVCLDTHPWLRAASWITLSTSKTKVQLPGVGKMLGFTSQCGRPADTPSSSPPGWTSFYPSLTVVHHGIPCHELEVGALCLPPGHRDAKQAANSLVCEKIRR